MALAYYVNLDRRIEAEGAKDSAAATDFSSQRTAKEGEVNTSHTYAS